MQRRDFMLKAASLAATGILIAGCTTSATTNATSDTSAGAGQHQHSEIDANVDATLNHLEATVPGSRDLIAKADGVLVFPSVIAAGLAIGGEYGEGALQVHHKTTGYYSLASLSFGLQIGAQSKAIVFLMMTPDALNKFRASQGWAVGGDASVAVAKIGANGMVEAANGPVVAFVLTNAGLMANLTFEGTKITPLKAA